MRDTGWSQLPARRSVSAPVAAVVMTGNRKEERPHACHLGLSAGD
jgi:hypothetical protein